MCVICRREVKENTTYIECYSCPNLTSLELKLGLKNCEELKILDCSECDLLDSIEGIGHCNKLEILNVHSCSNLASLEGLNSPYIRNLNCSNCPLLTIEGFNSGLENCKNIERLLCSNCPLLTSLEVLENCKDLELLQCNRCPITSLKPLENCPLRWLFCCKCPLLTSLKPFNTYGDFCLQYSGCPWLKESSYEYDSNIKKLIKVQRSCKMWLFRIRLYKSCIFKKI
jgi:Leucine-rich repeat (LRR) protein